jgi:ATP-dependent protease ClpP protease subunit
MAKGKFFNVVETAPGKASLMLYGEIGGDDGVNPEAVNSELLALQQAYPDIDVHINSMGGEVFAGIAIFNSLRSAQSRINIYVDGIAASIAGIIALCGKPLHMSRYSRLMLHQVSAGCSGGAREMRECADLIEGLETTLAEMISAKCGMPAEEVKMSFFDGTDHWFTAQEAYDRRLCDYIYDMAGADSLGTVPTAEQVYQFANNAIKKDNKSSNCHSMDIIAEIKKETSFQDLTDEQIVAKVRTLANDAAKVAALEAKIDQLETEAAAAKQAAVKAYLDQAVADGRIESAQVETYQKLMAADETSVRALIDGMPKKQRQVNITDYLKNGASEGEKKDLASMSWDEIDKAERLAELKDKFPELYKAKFSEKFGRK